MLSSKLGRIVPLQPNHEPLTAIDARILDALRDNARISNKALAERVGIAPSTCHGRVRALEEAGVILGYRASVDLAACGLPVRALIAAKVQAGARPRMIRICEELSASDVVLGVYLVGGEHDILVDVACATTADLRDYVSDNLGRNRDIAATESTIVFDHFEPGG